MTQRIALVLLAVCAGVAAPAWTVQTQDSVSVQCPLPGNPYPVSPNLIWAFG